MVGGFWINSRVHGRIDRGWLRPAVLACPPWRGWWRSCEPRCRGTPVAGARLPPPVVLAGQGADLGVDLGFDVGVTRLVGREVDGVVVEADGGPDLLAHLDHHVDILGEELLGVLAALAKLLALVRVPGAGLLGDAEVDGNVEQRAFPADASPVHDVELGLLERGADLVLDDLHPGAVPHDLSAVLDRLDAADVETDR